MKRLALIAVLLLAGCATHGQAIDVNPPKEVDLPVGIPCTGNIGPDPSYPDTDAALRAAPGIYDRVKLLVEGRLMRIQRDKEKQAALDACRVGGVIGGSFGATK